MSKTDRKQKRPNVAPAALLRARLETSWLAENSAQQTLEQLQAALQAASQGLKPEQVINVVLSVLESAQHEVQAKLETVLLQWLAQRDGLRALESLAVRDRLPAAQKLITLRWLAASGRDVGLLAPSPESTFHSAYELDDSS